MYLYHYKYGNSPLTKCPDCGGDLKEEGGINLVLSIGGHVCEIPSKLDEQGVLQDTDDHAVANGYHSVTECGQCGQFLVTYEWCEER